jgi:hypothetical protein
MSPCKLQGSDNLHKADTGAGANVMFLPLTGKTRGCNAPLVGSGDRGRCRLDPAVCKCRVFQVERLHFTLNPGTVWTASDTTQYAYSPPI